MPVEIREINISMTLLQDEASGFSGQFDQFGRTDQTDQTGRAGQSGSLGGGEMFGGAAAEAGSAGDFSDLTGQAANLTAAQRQELINACVRAVMQILREKREA